MSATTRDIFGDAGGAQPAVHGSYGEAPRAGRLPDATTLGRVRLMIANMDRSLSYYQAVLGLRVLHHDGARAELAAHGDDRGQGHPDREQEGLDRFAKSVSDIQLFLRTYSSSGN